LGPPTPEGCVTVGDTHFTEQDLTRPVALRILHTERKKFLFKNKNSLCKLQHLTMFYSKAFKDGMFNGIVHLRRGREGLRKHLLNMDLRLSGHRNLAREFNFSTEVIFLENYPRPLARLP